MKAAVRLDRVSFSYKSSEVLTDVSLEIAEESFTVLLGRNGSGKSTLLKVIAGLLKPTRGAVAVMERSIADLSLTDRARMLGYLPQFHRPVFPFSAEDVVLTGRASYVRFTPGEKDRAKAVAALERVGVADLRHRPFTELSGGEQQMVMIARVLAQEPKIVLLDEPTAHLDLANQTRILRFLKGLAGSGYTIIAVLHDPNTAFLYGDGFIFLKNGQIEELAAGKKPWEPGILGNVYGLELDMLPHKGRAFVIPRTGG
ncbi:MAG: ABC transporter ATP-binding protein [Syntrophobacteraceae bacterium]